MFDTITALEKALPAPARGKNAVPVYGFLATGIAAVILIGLGFHLSM